MNELLGLELRLWRLVHCLCDEEGSKYGRLLHLRRRRYCDVSMKLCFGDSRRLGSWPRVAGLRLKQDYVSYCEGYPDKDNSIKKTMKDGLIRL